MSVVTRFAPSPNGPLHLGHAYSAVIAEYEARVRGGNFLLRIEDIDGPRSRSEFADEFRRDLDWLGLEWREVPAQSTRLGRCRSAAERLERDGLLYKCTATRREIGALPPRRGEDGVLYPGRPKSIARPPATGEAFAMRLDVDAAMARVGALIWEDRADGAIICDPREFGDVVLVRKDLPASYHLAATLDDAADAITLVTRGEDLFTSTHIHRLLQALLELPVPRYFHHDLILDDDGSKLAKSRGSPALSDRRKSGDDGLALAQELLERFLKRQNKAGT